MNWTKINSVLAGVLIVVLSYQLFALRGLLHSEQARLVSKMERVQALRDAYYEHLGNEYEKSLCGTSSFASPTVDAHLTLTKEEKHCIFAAWTEARKEVLVAMK